MKTFFILVIISFWFNFSANGQNTRDNYLFYPSKNKEQKNGWIILLPGSSGLKIFDDQHFYHRKAERLSNNNFDVILVDYKQYYKNSRDVSKPQKSTGEKIAWTVKEVLSEMDTRKLITKNSPGHIIGWSLAGEGVFHLI